VIRVDVSNVVPPGLMNLMSAQRRQATLQKVAESARLKWVQLAGKGLKASSASYIEGLSPVKMSTGRATITLTGRLPNMIEHGWDGGDMRNTLLGPGARNRKPTKDKKGNITGWYNTIPFRHGTPKSSGRNFMPMGGAEAKALDASMGSPVQMALGQQVYKAAKALRPTHSMLTTTPAGAVYQTQWGGRMKNDMSIPKLKPHHATNIYAGMVRQRETYKEKTQTQYTTFRRISTNVKNGWFHPGIRARNIAKEVQKHVERVAPKAFARAMLEALNGG